MKYKKLKITWDGCKKFYDEKKIENIKLRWRELKNEQKKKVLLGTFHKLRTL